MELKPLQGDGIDHLFNPDHYKPKTSSDRAKIEERKQLTWKIQPIPIGYVGNERAVVFTNNTPRRAGQDHFVCDDCKAVEAKIRALITPYPGATP